MKSNKRAIRRSPTLVRRSNATPPDIKTYAKLYRESICRERQLCESASDDEIISNVFSSLLTFMSGDGEKILRDSEWMNYLVNDIQQAVQSGLFKPDRESQEQLQALFLG